MGLKLLDIPPPEEMVQLTVKTGVTLLYLSFVHAKSLVFKIHSCGALRKYARMPRFLKRGMNDMLCHSRGSGNPENFHKMFDTWMPAFAGMTDC